MRRDYKLTLYKEIFRIPSALACLVGQIMARFTFIEYQLKAVVSMLGRVRDNKLRRIILRTPRVEEYIDMVQELVELEQFTLTSNLAKLKGQLKQAESQRNLYAHTVWQKHPKTRAIIASKTRGSWPKSDPIRPGVSRKIAPESVPVTKESLRKVRDAMDALISDLNGLHADAVRALKKSAGVKH